jgi:uncharacterized cupredoxin-like copper-binding protein
MFAQVSVRNLALSATIVLAAACHSPRPTYAKFDIVPLRSETVSTEHAPVKTVKVELSEWKVAVGDAALVPGPVTFEVHNGGATTHAFEVEGNGIEKRTRNIAPNATASLTVELKAGHYEAYCPVAAGAHKASGMLTELEVSGK